MSPESGYLDQAVARALRANLEGLRRQSEELHQAIADLVAACSSSRPSNALPHIVRAQAGAAAVEAVLEVLSKFITRSAQSSRGSADDYSPVTVSTPAPEAPAAPQRPVRSIPAPMDSDATIPSPSSAAFVQPPAPGTAPWEMEPPVPAAVEESDSSESIEVIEPPAPEPAHIEPEPVPAQASSGSEDGDGADHESIWQAAEQAVSGKAPGATPAGDAASVSKDGAFFDISTLPAEQQEMHRRASRVAKVSMQDIKLLQPDAVNKGREQKDICIRLKDEIEKARKEYERRFRPILGQGVDYFHQWMVEVLAAGDADALGEYPYHPAMRQ
jgi:hypothetical protein